MYVFNSREGYMKMFKDGLFKRYGISDSEKYDITSEIEKGVNYPIKVRCIYSSGKYKCILGITPSSSE